MKIDINNPFITHANFNAMQFDDYGVAAIQRVLTKYKLKDTVRVNDSGHVTIERSFYYTSAIIPDEDDPDKGIRKGTRIYTLDAYINAVFRLQRLNQSKVSKIQSAFDGCQKIMNNIWDEIKP